MTAPASLPKHVLTQTTEAAVLLRRMFTQRDAVFADISQPDISTVVIVVVISHKEYAALHALMI